jgi:hypothetical protein
MVIDVVDGGHQPGRIPSFRTNRYQERCPGLPAGGDRGQGDADEGPTTVCTAGHGLDTVGQLIVEYSAVCKMIDLP